MENTGLPNEVIIKIKEITKKYTQYDFYIFGSRAKGTYKKISDIDIAIFENAPDDDKFKIMNEFDLLDIIYKIDLVFVNEITKKTLLESIKQNRIKI